MTTIETALRRLGTTIDYPKAPDLVPGVLRSIETPPTSRAVRGSAWMRRAALVAAITALVVAVVPGLRTEVAGWLGLGGVSLVEAPAVLDAADELDLGSATSLEDAAVETGFRPLIPTELGAPDGVFTIAGQIWMIYQVGPGLTEMSLDGVGAVVVEFETGEGPGLIKTVAASDQGTFFALDGTVALWIEGPHDVGVLDPAGELAGRRMADNTLLWELEELTLRLETTLPREQAIVIARSFR